MSVKIQLDSHTATYCTNLEFVTGKVVLSLTKNDNVSAIVVKLEGECKTTLTRPHTQPNKPHIYEGTGNTRNPIALENHKIIYKVLKVFPDPNRDTGSAGLAYYLPPGQHEYPFGFKISFDNSCWNPEAQQVGLKAAGIAVFGLGATQQYQYTHVKKTLPPSLTGFPGYAEIRYYVKVTVQRPSLFKENWRADIDFEFLPVEPPRQPPTTQEVFARRQHEFQIALPSKSAIFKKKTPTQPSDRPPKVEVEARLPSPAILTCTGEVPLRIIARKLNDSLGSVFIMSLQIRLLGETEVRAQGISRIEKSHWFLTAVHFRPATPIALPQDKLGAEIIVDRTYWGELRLPNTVYPSFHCCDLTRTYVVEIDIELSCSMQAVLQVSDPLYI